MAGLVLRSAFLTHCSRTCSGDACNSLHAFCCDQIISSGRTNESPFSHFQYAFVEAFVHMLVDCDVVLGKEGHSTDWTARSEPSEVASA
jgi:hypothetical protein